MSEELPHFVMRILRVRKTMLCNLPETEVAKEI